MITADDIRHLKQLREFLEEVAAEEGAYGNLNIDQRKWKELEALFDGAIQNCEAQVRYNTAQAYRLLPGV